MRRDERLNRLIEWESADAHVIHRNALVREDVEGFTNRGVASADGDDCRTRALPGFDYRRRYESRRFLVLAQQPVHHFLVLVGNFGVAAVFVVARAAREEGALRVHSGQRAGGDVAAVFRRIAQKFRESVDFRGTQDAAAIGPV